MTRAVQRIEIVIDAPHLPRMLRALTAAGAPGYTVVPGATGQGDRGEQRGDDVSGVSSNAYVLVAAEPDRVQPILDAVRPLLAAYGGLCLISEAQWLEH